MAQTWTPEEVADLHLPWEEFSQRYPERTYKAYWNKRDSLKTVAPVFQDRKKPFQKDELEAYFDKFIALAKERLDRDSKQVEVTLDIATDRPVGIAFTGDWHIGQVGTDYRRLKRDNRLLAETSGLYVVGMGDYVHNAKSGTRPGNALYDSLFPDPHDQYDFAFHELEKLKGKIIALTIGCHLDWDHQLAGIDTLDDICAKLETVNLWHGGVIHLKVGDETYHIGARHKYRGESNINSTNAQRTFYDQYPEDEHLDIICLAHLHYCDLQKRSRRGGKVTYLRSGGYYIWDEFGQKIGGFKGEPGVPVAILFPNKHKVLPFEGSDLEEAVEVLNLLRSN